MEQNEFEQRVHQKMEGMQMLPSEEIWRKVDERLHPENRRRRWFLWIFLLFAGLGTGGYLVWHSMPAVSSQKAGTSGLSVTVNQRSSGLRSTSKRVIISGEPHAVNKVAFVPDKSQVEKLLPGSGRYVRNDTLQKRPRSTSVVSTDSASTKAKDESILQKTPSASLVFDSTKMPEPVEESVSPEAFLYEAPLHKGDSIRVVPAAAVVALPVLKFPRSPALRWGLVLAGGKSGSNDGVFNKLLPSAAMYNSSPSSGLSQNNSNYVPPSAVKSGLALKAGFFMQRTLRPWLNVSAGINYSMFSFSNEIGVKVDSAVTIAGNSSADRMMVNRYFRTGASKIYVNRYHFIELPVMMAVNFSSIKRSPFSFELGFSLSRLVASNALHYNGSTGFYYENNRLFNRTQVNFIAGLPVRIYSSKHLNLVLGPQFQYGLTRLLSDQSSGSKHLSFLGLKAGLLF